MQQFYYPKTIAGVIIAILDMFNDLKIQKYDNSGSIVKEINIPITFAPQEKNQLLEARRNANTPNAFKSAPVPRLGLGLNSITYSSDRATAVNEIRYFYNTSVALSATDSIWDDMQPAPYDFGFTLYIRTDTMNDFSQILENILPYFNPSLYLRVKEFSFLNIERDLKTTLEGVNLNFLEPIPEDNSRYINADVNFTVQGFLYRPYSTSKIINTVKSNFLISEYDTDSSTWSDTISATSYSRNVSGVSGTSY